ncbi:hypothetical protein AVEN_239796-1 [Araneus ventricosus]|uniref:Uncharacterized protein n=1 Tax=Araneus ventricosus TaxID=182803 RepID=A0A4Y2EWX2_ARAVE|nr:hypothetical protein AVEN_239796-1 [Araneus ventricosus]
MPRRKFSCSENYNKNRNEVRAISTRGPESKVKPKPVCSPSLAQQDDKNAQDRTYVDQKDLQPTSELASPANEYTSFITATSTPDSWITEIYYSVNRQDKIDFVKALKESHRQYLFNSVKASPSKLQEWEEIFKTQTDNYKGINDSNHLSRTLESKFISSNINSKTGIPIGSIRYPGIKESSFSDSNIGG